MIRTLLPCLLCIFLLVAPASLEAVKGDRQITGWDNFLISLKNRSLAIGGLITRSQLKNSSGVAFWGKEPILESKEPLSETDMEIEKWKQRMRVCESSNNPSAVNPKDSDGTPSHGLWQFKIGTWKHYIKKYDLFNWRNWEEADWWNAIYSRYYQEEVIDNMLLDADVNWKREFPYCSKRLGTPPF